MTAKVLILHANGTNRDHELRYAFELAGADAEIVHLNQLRSKQKHFADYQILAIPGGFSYADTLGAGQLFALDLQIFFRDQMQEFIAQDKLVIGVCNGFQTLVKSGLLPDIQPRMSTLTFNQQNHFECRWVNLQPSSEKCVWTRGLSEEIYCPVAHGEGRFYVSDTNVLAHLQSNDQIALRYSQNSNPNGSIDNIAGICNSKGTVLGLMPHPEDHVHNYQHPHWTRGITGNLGLALFQNALKF